jgi:hypothetical protein
VTRRGEPTPARLVSIPAFAKARGVPYSTMWRTLRALAKADERDRGQCDWLFDMGPGRKKHINLSRLEVRHPALFHRRFVTREEMEDLAGRVVKVEVEQRELKKRQNAVGAGMRNLRSYVDEQLELRLGGSREIADPLTTNSPL